MFLVWLLRLDCVVVNVFFDFFVICLSRCLRSFLLWGKFIGGEIGDVFEWVLVCI